MTFLQILEKIQGIHVAVIGDPMVDEYHFGHVNRICPEAPVPVFVTDRIETRRGGADNVANQLEALGCKVTTCFPRSFSRKTRYVADSHMLLRVDDDVWYTPTEQDYTRVENTLTHMAFIDAVVLSDYAHGWLSPEMCRRVIDVAGYRSAPVIVDPKKDCPKFAGCELICPTEEEFKDLSGFLAGRAFPNVLIKRGAKGMQLHSLYCEEVDIPAVAKKVFDVTGAGDVVVAVVAAAGAVGASYLEAAQLAAIAAGYVVGEVGTTVCSRGKLKELIDGS